MTNKNYNCLVFDWDGTLVDSIERIATSLQFAAMHTCGISVSDKAARDVIGMGLMEAVARLLPDADADLLEQTAEAYKQHFLHESTVPSDLFDGVMECLDELKARGYQLAVATGKGRPGLDHALASHELSDYFVTTRCAGEFPSKPHPEMLLSIVRELEVSPERTLMIGDSEHDMRMAANAGIDAIAVSHGAHTEAELMALKPLMCLQHITDLSRVLSHNPTGA